MGCSRFSTAQDIYDSKMDPNYDGTPGYPIPAAIGKALEPIIVEQTSKKLGIEFKHMGEVVCWSTDNDYQAGSPDALSKHEVLEIKTTKSSQLSKWGTSKDGWVRPDAYHQVQWLMDLTDRESARVSVYFYDIDHTLRFRVVRNDKLIAQMHEVAQHFVETYLKPGVRPTEKYPYGTPDWAPVAEPERGRTRWKPYSFQLEKYILDEARKGLALLETQLNGGDESARAKYFQAKQWVETGLPKLFDRFKEESRGIK